MRAHKTRTTERERERRARGRPSATPQCSGQADAKSLSEAPPPPPSRPPARPPPHHRTESASGLPVAPLKSISRYAALNDVARGPAQRRREGTGEADSEGREAGPGTPLRVSPRGRQGPRVRRDRGVPEAAARAVARAAGPGPPRSPAAVSASDAELLTSQ